MTSLTILLVYGMQLQLQNRSLKKSLRKKLLMKGLQYMMNEQEEAMNLLLKKSKYYHNSKNLSKEIAMIKTQLLFLVCRVDRIQQETEDQKGYDN
jgi:hypothetical protein